MRKLKVRKIKKLASLNNCSVAEMILKLTNCEIFVREKGFYFVYEN